jgi:hypothetical protein
MTNKIDQVTPTEPKNLDELADAGPIAPINLTGETAVKPGNPVDLTEETEVTPGNPVNLTEEGISEPIAPRTTTGEAELAPSNPINLTEESISEPIAPRTITGESALAPGNPVNITAEALSKPIAPVTMTRVDAVPPARTGGDVVNLDFCNESYNVDFDYSRASSGSYIGRNLNQFNQYEYVLKNNFVGDVTNLALYSEELTQSPYVNNEGLVTTLASEKYKGSNVFKLLDNVNNDSSLTQAVTIPNDSLERTFAISIKKSTDAKNYAGIRVDTTGGTGVVVALVFNPFTGVISYQENTVITSSIVFDEGYWRVSLSYLNNSTGNTISTIRVYPAYNTTGSSTRTNAITGSALVTRLSLTVSAKPVEYVKTLAAAVTKSFTASPRIEYDAATGECLGYLAEGASTNLALRSEEFNNSEWTTNATPTITANYGVSPDNTKSSDRFETISSASGVYDSLTTVASTVYTLSVFLKALNDKDFKIELGFVDAQINVNPLSGLITSIGSDVSSSSVESYGNGWFRFAMSYEAASTSTLVKLYGSDGGDCLVWGAQLEALLFASSYIRTEGSAVTRAADSLELSIAPNIGTVFVNANFLGGADKNSGNRYALLLDDSTTDNSVLILNGEAKNSSLFTRVNGTVQTLLTGLPDSTGAFNKVVSVISDINNNSLYTNGALTSSNSGLKPKGMTLVSIGSDLNANNSMFGHIKKTTFYNYEMTADEVKAL